MACGHGVFQYAVILEPAGVVAVSCGETVVPGILQAKSGSLTLSSGLDTVVLMRVR